MAAQLAEVADQIRENLADDAIDADGFLAESYHGSKLGKQYLELWERRRGAASTGNHEDTVYNHFVTFFRTKSSPPFPTSMPSATDCSSTARTSGP